MSASVVVALLQQSGNAGLLQRLLTAGNNATA
jgi:hypothetical protein